MVTPIERCENLVNIGSVKLVEVGEYDGKPAIFACGEPILHAVSNTHAVLHCSANAKRILLQTDPGVYEDLPGHPKDDVLVDFTRIGDEELKLHIQQAAHQCAVKKGQG